MFSRIVATLGVGVLTLLIFGLLKWLNIPTGNIIDWLIGLASFYWLLAVVTIPWNIYFEAKEVLQESKISKKRGITVENESVDYPQKIAYYSLLAAIILHLSSALGLYLLAVTGVSAVGYASSIATLLLTFLRPTVRFYQYIVYRLSTIRETIKYPREDVLTLLNRVSRLESNIQQVQQTLNLENPNSFITQQVHQLQSTRQELGRTKALLEQLEATNKVEHERLSREAQQYMAQLTEDSQFLSHVREIIRLWKTA